MKATRKDPVIGVGEGMWREWEGRERRGEVGIWMQNRCRKTTSSVLPHLHFLAHILRCKYINCSNWRNKENKR